MSDVTDYKINDMVQQASNHAIIFNGVVVGFTVNSIGEPILLVDMTVHKTNAVGMEESGYERVAHTYNTFWHRISPIHPSNVIPFYDINNLVEDSQ
jgi:hypothetical protein